MVVKARKRRYLKSFTELAVLFDHPIGVKYERVLLPK